MYDWLDNPAIHNCRQVIVVSIFPEILWCLQFRATELTITLNLIVHLSKSPAVMHGSFLFVGLDSFRPRIFYSPTLIKFLGPDSRSRLLTRHRSVSPRPLALATKVASYKTYFFSLCGLWFGQDLFEQRSGMVLVPSIIRLPQRSQIFPVGFAFIAFLQAG